MFIPGNTSICSFKWSCRGGRAGRGGGGNISNLTVLFWQALQTGAVIFAIHSLGSEPPYRINQVLRYDAQYICSYQGIPPHVHLNGVAEAAEQGGGGVGGL